MSQIMNPPIVNYIPQAQDYTQDFLAGIKQGQELQAFRKQQELVQKQELFKQDYNVLSQSPSGKGMLDLMIKYPEFAATLKPIQEAYSGAEKQGELSQMMQIDNALRYNNPELAKKLVMQTKTAFENAGKDTKNLDTIIETIDANPDLARGSIGMTLAQLMGDKYETYEKGLTERLTQGAKVSKVEAETKEATLKNEATTRSQNQSILMTGLVDASTALLQNNKEGALSILKSEKQNASTIGMPTSHYDKAINLIEAGDTTGAKRTIDVIGLGVYGKDWKDIITGQTKVATQSSELLEAESKATIEKAKADNASSMAKLDLELKKIEKTNKHLETQKLNTQIKSEKIGITVKQQELKTKTMEYLGKMNDLGGKMNANAGVANQGYNTVNSLIKTSKDLDAKLKEEKEKNFPATGTVIGRLPTIRDVSKAVTNDIENVKSGVTLMIAEMNKGVLTPMSDSDVAILEKAATSLSEYSSPEENQRQLKKINIMIANYKHKIKVETGLDEFQAKKYKQYIPRNITGTGKTKPDPLGLFGKGK